MSGHPETERGHPVEDAPAVRQGDPHFLQGQPQCLDADHGRELIGGGDDPSRGRPAHSRLRLRHRQVGSQVDDPPAGSPQQVGQQQWAEGMVLSRRADDQNGVRTGGRRGGSQEGLDPARGQVGCEVLLVDGGIAPIPGLADLGQPRLQDLCAGHLGREYGQRLSESRIGGGFVKGQACGDPGIPPPFQRFLLRGGLLCRSAGVAHQWVLPGFLQRPPERDGLPDGHPFGEAPGQPAHRLHIPAGVEAAAGGRAEGKEVRSGAPRSAAWEPALPSPGPRLSD